MNQKARKLEQTLYNRANGVTPDNSILERTKTAFVRHGETNLNDDTDERLRSHLDVPLNDKGRQSAQEAADALAKVDDVAPFDRIYTSDLGRARETAHIINQRLGGKLPITVDPNLRPWDLGALAGHKLKDVLPTMQKLIDTPDIQAPKGESFNQFLQRFAPAAKQITDSDSHNIMIGHTRTAAALDAIEKNGGRVPQDLSSFKAKHPLNPGGIMFVGADKKLRMGDTPEKSIKKVEE